MFTKIKNYFFKIFFPEIIKKHQRLNSYEIDFIFEGKKVIWLEPWEAITSISSLQNELNKELSTDHPIHHLKPKVIARTPCSDDIFVALDNGQFAEVHLTWQGKVDQIPEKFPRWHIYNSIYEFPFAKIF